MASCSSSSSSNPESGDGFAFRSIDPTDHDVIKALHEECFPVKYSDRFFRDACMGKGFRGGDLYTCLCVEQATQRVVGFIFAQIQTETEAEDKGLLGARSPGNLLMPTSGGGVGGAQQQQQQQQQEQQQQQQQQQQNSASSPSGARYVCYILTLGLVTSYRRSGLGSQLLEHCVNHARANPNCGAVYLHVIHNNPAAIAFYKRNDFLHLRTLSHFYVINGESHTALLLIFYINNFSRPAWHRLLLSVRSVFDGVVFWFASLLSHLQAPVDNDEQRRAAQSSSSEV